MSLDDLIAVLVNARASAGAPPTDGPGRDLHCDALAHLDGAIDAAKRARAAQPAPAPAPEQE